MNRILAGQLRTLLILGRASNLPTIWSNCLAGWWLSGGGNAAKVPLLLAGASALYLGGMFLNDAFDEKFDRQRRAVRPIPAGLISAAAVWRFGWGWLALGLALLWLTGPAAGVLGLVLVACILVYDATHKLITASPWLMGLCRFWVYVIAGTTGADGLNGWSVWCGLALVLYIAGLSHVARRENLRGPVPCWPLILLAAPLFLALLMNQAEYRWPAVWLGLVLALWVARCVWTVFTSAPVNVIPVVSGLLAGIALVDWLAVAPECPWGLGLVFLILFGATQLWQQSIPAT
jgi:4-hydroxybenzoate polyprenyltransferase